MTYQFNGTTNYLEEVSSDFASLPLTVFLRSSATSALSGNQTLLAFANATDGSQCNIRSSGNSIAQVRQQNATGTGTNVGVAQIMNQWGTLVGRFNANNSRDIFDSGGKTSGTATVSGSTAYDRLIIGCGVDNAGAKTAFTQLLANIVAVWNVALSDDECLSLTSKMVSPLLVRPQSLIRLYDLENLNDKMGSRSLTPVNSPVLISADVGRKKYPRRLRQG